MTNDDVRALAEEFWEALLEANPSFATFVGTLTNAPLSPNDPIQVQGCYTCHGYGCGNGN